MSLRTLKTIAAEAAFGPEAGTRLETGCCPSCGDKPASDSFYDERSAREFAISGLCQKCQDEVFGATRAAVPEEPQEERKTNMPEFRDDTDDTPTSVTINLSPFTPAHVRQVAILVQQLGGEAKVSMDEDVALFGKVLHVDASDDEQAVKFSITDEEPEPEDGPFTQPVLEGEPSHAVA